MPLQDALQMSPLVRRMTPLTLAMLLAACGGGGGGGSGSGTTTPPPTEVTRKIIVVPSLGQMRQAEVIITQLNGDGSQDDKELQRAVTGTSGIIIFEDIPANAGVVKIEVRGIANSVYFDEALERFVPFEGSMHTIVNVIDDTSVAVTPWTEAAYQYARKLAGSKTPTLAQLTTVFDTFSKQAGVPILKTQPTLVDDPADLRKLIANSGDAYALSLAALAYQARSTLGNEEPAPAARILRAFAQDGVDGKIDGQGANGAIADLPYQGSSFFDEYSNQINRLIANFELPDNLRNALQPKAPELPPVITDPKIEVIGDSSITEFQPVNKTTALEGTDVVYRWVDVNNGFIAVSIQENGKIRMISFSPTPNKAYQCFDEGCAGVTITNGGRQINFSNTPLETGVKLNGSLIAISPPSSNNQISASGTVTTTSFAFLSFQPDPTGFESFIDSASFGGETFVFRQGNSASLTVQTDAMGRVSGISLQAANRDWRCSGVAQCQGATVFRNNGGFSISFKFNTVLLTDLNNPQDTITINSELLTGGMSIASAWLYRDLPLSTTGSITVNSSTDELLAAQYQAQRRNGQTIDQVLVATPQMKLTVEQNRSTQQSTASLWYLPTNQTFECSDNCGSIAVSTGGLVSLNLNEVNFANQPPLKISTRLQLIPAVQGSLSSNLSSLKTFAPTRSSIQANNEWLTVRFEQPQIGASLDVRFDPQTKEVTSAILNTGNGTESYSCYNPRRTTNDEICAGIGVDDNLRGVRFANTALKGGTSSTTNQLIRVNTAGVFMVAQGR